MGTFRVELGPDSYPVHVGAGALDQTGRIALEAGMPAGPRGSSPITTSRACMANARLTRSAAAGFAPLIVEVAAGEPSKSLATLERVLRRDC